MRSPNLLVIMCDQLRASALELYREAGRDDGLTLARTPHLAALARSGVTYRWAFTPSPVCVPARVAFWTGRWPRLTGSVDNRVYLQPGETHLLQPLRERGYATGLIGKNHCFTDQDIQTSFDTYYPVGHAGPADDEGDPDVAGAKQFIRTLGGAGGKAYACGVSPYPVEKHGTWRIGDRADRFIRAQHAGQPDRPWCAWVSIADPHTPYQVSEPYASLYPPESLQLPPSEPPGCPGKPARFRLFAELMETEKVADDHLRRVLSIYYGMIALIDDVVGRLLATLDELALREDTIVVFTADHGDYMTEHRMVRKGASMADALTHVPLLVSYPRRVPQGETSTALVSTLDVFPTLTHLMDLPLPPARSGQPLPMAVEQVNGAPEREVVFSEHGTQPGPVDADAIRRHLAELAAAGRPRGAPFQLAANGQKKMARTHDWKYVHHAGGEGELYDLRADPHELVNLANQPEQRERVADFRRLLLEWLIETEDVVPPGFTAAGGDTSMGGEGRGD
jgi:arylsulfatase